MSSVVEMVETMYEENAKVERKLTKPQERFLRRIKAHGAVFAVSNYPPVRKLLGFGFITKAKDSYLRWTMTNSGMDWLSKHPE